MKRLLIGLLVVLGFETIAQPVAYAQDLVYLVPEPKTARWSYIESNAEGKPVTKYYYSVESMKGDGINGSVKLRIEEISLSSPADTVKGDIFYRFKDGEFMVDMNAVFEGEVLESIATDALKDEADISEQEVKETIDAVRSQISVSGEIRGIPRYPQVGALPDYEFQFKFSIMNMKVLGRDRKIVGKEQIDTPAGSYDCFVMEETIITKALLMKDVEKTKSWYAYGIGLVKEMTYDKNGKLLSSMVLDSVNW